MKTEDILSTISREIDRLNSIDIFKDFFNIKFSSVSFLDKNGELVHSPRYSCNDNHDGINVSMYNSRKHYDVPIDRLLSNVFIVSLCPACIEHKNYSRCLLSLKTDKFLVYPKDSYSFMYFPIHGGVRTIANILKKHGLPSKMDITKTKVLNILGEEGKRKIVRVAFYDAYNQNIDYKINSRYLVRFDQDFEFIASQVFRLMCMKKQKYVYDLVDIYYNIDQIKIIQSSDNVNFPSQIELPDGLSDLEYFKVIDSKTGEVISVLECSNDTVFRVREKNLTYIDPMLFKYILREIEKTYVYRDVAYPNGMYYKKAGLIVDKVIEGSAKTYKTIGSLLSNVDFIRPVINESSYEAICRRGEVSSKIVSEYVSYPIEVWKDKGSDYLKFEKYISEPFVDKSKPKAKKKKPWKGYLKKLDRVYMDDPRKICVFCGKEATDSHILKEHRIKPVDYYVEFIGKSRCKQCNRIASFQSIEKGYTDFCSRSCSSKYTNRSKVLYPDNPRDVCVYCGKPTDKHVKIHNTTEKKYYDTFIGDIKKCRVCGNKSKFINIRKGYMDYCEKHIPKVYLSKYGSVVRIVDGIRLKSKSEYQFYSKLKEYGIDFEYESASEIITYMGYDGKLHKYYPDFYLPKYNMTVEIKYDEYAMLDKWVLLKKYEYLRQRPDRVYRILIPSMYDDILKGLIK